METKTNKTRRFRATFAAGATNEPRLGGVDRENEVLHDVQITLEGEAKGHGIWLDREFCAAVAAQGNERGDAGVKVRFGHPAMCSDALGTYLGRAKNFRVVDLTRTDGTAAAGVIADIHLAKESHTSPNGDLAAWVMDTAENSPDTFGQSIVFKCADYKIFDDDGNAHLLTETDPKEWDDLNDGTRRVFAVLGTLHGTDFTDSPAATDGVFSADSIAAQAEEMLDAYPEVLEAIGKNPDSMIQFLDRTGLLDKFETARIKGLQAKMGKSYDALKAQHEAALESFRRDADENHRANEEAHAAYEASLAEHLKLLAEKDALINDLQTQLNQATIDLGVLQDTRTSLTAQLTEAKESLARTGDQLAKVNNRLVKLGHDVNRIPDEEAWDYGEQLAKTKGNPEAQLAVAQKEVARKNRKR